MSYVKTVNKIYLVSCVLVFAFSRALHYLYILLQKESSYTLDFYAYSTGILPTTFNKDISIFQLSNNVEVIVNSHIIPLCGGEYKLDFWQYQYIM